MEIKGEVPWRAPLEILAGCGMMPRLISYVESHYGTFSARNYDIAVAKVTDDRSYHPIREFIENLPEWDKVPRVDTLLIDYLGADDNEYVRAVARKTRSAPPYKRIYMPGCKFKNCSAGAETVPRVSVKAPLSPTGRRVVFEQVNLGDTKDKDRFREIAGVLDLGNQPNWQV